MKVTVTQEDIDNGQRCSCTKCPIALAIRRNKDCDGYSINVLSICIKLGYRRFILPDKAEEFIRFFDLGAKVKPFTFIAKEDKNES